MPDGEKYFVNRPLVVEATLTNHTFLAMSQRVRDAETTTYGVSPATHC